MDAVAGEASETQDVAPLLCKAGKHPASPENFDKRGRCKLCQREWFKERWRRLHPERRKSPSWDGTLDQFFQLGLIKVSGRHWLWRGKVNRHTKRPAFGQFGRRAVSVARILWGVTGHPPIPEENILIQNTDLCRESLCVHPDCHRSVPKGMNLSTEDRQRITRKSAGKRRYLTLDKRIQRRIAKDDTGCWRWLGTFLESARGTKRPYFIFRDKTNRTISVRRFVYERVKGKIPLQHVLYHRSDMKTLCSHPDECVAPAHMALVSKQRFGAEVCAVKRRDATKRRQVGRLEWPGTLWEPGANDRCQHCRRSFQFHGAPEWVARKLGFTLNQQHRVCMPTVDAEK